MMSDMSTRAARVLRCEGCYAVHVQRMGPAATARPAINHVVSNIRGSRCYCQACANYVICIYIYIYIHMLH